MPRNYNQTGTAMGCSIGAYCSGLSANSGSFSRLCTVGGSAGTEGTFTVDGSATNLRAIYFELAPVADIEWGGGTWTININVTTSAANTTWETCYICRVNSSCTNQATIGSATGLAIALNATGVKSTNITGTAQASAVKGSDKVLIVCGITNSNTCTRTLGITPNQVITSPFSVIMGGWYRQHPIAPTVNEVIGY